MILLIALWLTLLVALIVFAIGKPGEGGGLTLAYFLGLSLIHLPGAYVYLDSSILLPSQAETESGFLLTVSGLAAFTIGAILVRLTDKEQIVEDNINADDSQKLNQFGLRLIAIGAVSYFVILPFASYFSSLTAVVGGFGALLLLGIWVRFYVAVNARSWRQMSGLIAALPALPLSTLVTGGFIGYGIYWIISVGCFLFAIVRRRLIIVVASPFIAYLGLSLFVGYMAERNAIRDLVWSDESTFGERADRVFRIFSNFEFLNIGNEQHVVAIDGRLNQNVFVGLAINRHRDGILDFQYGGTVQIWALVPRALWPEKPEIGGGGTLVSELTGLEFGVGTSVGVGQVLEFYANFGWFGIVFGFGGLGALLLNLDRGIMRALVARDFRGFLFRGMPGLVLLQPGGNLLEIMVAVVAAIVGAQIVTTYEKLYT